MGKGTHPFDDHYKKLTRPAFDEEVVRVNGKLAELINVLGRLDERTLDAYPALETAAHVLIDAACLLDKQRRKSPRPNAQTISDEELRRAWNEYRDMPDYPSDYAAAVQVAKWFSEQPGDKYAGGISWQAVLQRAKALHLGRERA
jgi:hypothetical protein